MNLNRNAHGSIKNIVAKGCLDGLTAREIAEMIGTSAYTVYSVARRMGLKPRHVYKLKKYAKSNDFENNGPVM